MPEEHFRVKSPESLGEKAARKEQQLTDEQETDRGILPKTPRNILLITGILLVVSAAVYFIILRVPTIGVKENVVEVVTPAPQPTEPEGDIPAAVREGRIARVLGAEDTRNIRASVEMRNEGLETSRPIGVIPHPYLNKIPTGGYTAVATRELIAGKTIFRLSATLPKIEPNVAYRVYLGNQGAARELGILVHMESGLYALIASEEGFNFEPFIYLTGPDPKNPEQTVTILSGTFETV